MAFGNHGKNGKLGVTFATYLLLASFVLVVGRYQGWYQVRPDYSVDVPVESLFDRDYDARIVCPEQQGVRVLRIARRRWRLPARSSRATCRCARCAASSGTGVNPVIRNL